MDTADLLLTLVVIWDTIPESFRVFQDGHYISIITVLNWWRVTENIMLVRTVLSSNTFAFDTWMGILD